MREKSFQTCSLILLLIESGEGVCGPNLKDIAQTASISIYKLLMSLIMDWNYCFAIFFVSELLFVNKVCGKCYFPGELQGVWATQAAPNVVNAPIGYTMVTIDANEISTWGRCHSKIDHDIILADRSRPYSAPCFRCFRLVVASLNVAALVSGGLEKCHDSVESALASCPKTERGAAHIVLYKIRSSWGEVGLLETQCPFSGIYFFSFEKGERGYRGMHNMRCEQPTSELSNCPFGFSLSLQYRDCTFNEPRAANWHCLGSWKGLDGQQYTAFLDTYSKEGDGKPKYKCGIYQEDKKRGRVFLAFSRDSTCTNGLLNAQDGHERYALYRAPSSPLPNSVRDRECRFPSSFRGKWHNLEVDRSSIVYRDELKFNTLQMQCVRDFGDSERYAVYTRTDCGKWYYTCILLKRRSANVMELMFGRDAQETLRPELCDRDQFGNMSQWITQARVHLKFPTSCPIVGTYRGELPDSPGYCTQLFSDCARTDLMYYAVDECTNHNLIYERKRISKGRGAPSRESSHYKRERKRHRIPNTNPRPRGQSRLGIPTQVQVSSGGFIHTGNRPRPTSRIYEIPLPEGISIVVAKKRKRRERPRDFFYRPSNPRTTTISFAWGKPDSTTTTTSLPYVGNVTNIYSEGGAYENGRSRSRENLRPPVTPAMRPPFNHGSSNRGGLRRDNDYGKFQSPSQRPESTKQFHSDNTRKGQRHEQFPSNIPRKAPTREQFVGHSRGSSWSEGRIKSFQSNQPKRFPTIARNPTLINSRLPYNHFDYRRDNPRYPPIKRDQSRSDSLGFWPRNSKKVNPGENNYRRFSDLPEMSYSRINRPRTRTSLDFEPNWRATFPTPPPWQQLPSPSASIRDISFISSPSTLDVSNEKEKSSSSNAKRKPTVQEREYQCLGEWQENNYIYALTRRRDIHTYECFVGMKTTEGIVYLKEAGSSCTRGVKPDEFGMKTLMKDECPKISVSSRFDRPKKERNDVLRETRRTLKPKKSSPTRPPWVPSTTRPWEPITGRPRKKALPSSTSRQEQNRSVLCLLLIYSLLSQCRL